MKTKIPKASELRIGWLSGHLSRKTMMGLVAVAVLSGVLMCLMFTYYLGLYATGNYEAMAGESQDLTAQLCTYLEEHGLDTQTLKEYVDDKKISCEIRGEDGRLLFESMPPPGEIRFAVSGGGTAKLGDGSQVTVYTWLNPMREKEIGRLFTRHALAGLIVLNLCIFTIVAVMLYLLVLSPIISLRRTMRDYYEHGAMPKQSPRRDEIGRLQNTFVTMAGVLENKEQTERRIVASVSHDIKTPLTSVMGYSERLLSAKLDAEKQKQYLRSIYDKALVIKTVADEFDEYLEAGFRDSAPIDLMTVGDFCARIREEYQNELSDAGVTFEVQCSCPAVQIRCNYDHLRRVFGNLIGNSIQHSESQALALRLMCAREEDQAVFSFCDNGKGVAPDLLGQIFEPFFTTDRGRKVSGLGLAICRNIIRAHGGNIRAENLSSGGLRIEIRLPQAG